MPVELKGFKALEKQLDEIAEEYEKGFDREALAEAAEIAVKAVKARAPVRTGKLKESITASAAESRSGKPTIRIGPSKRSKAFYGRMLEFGTSKLPAQPWLRPGFRAVRREIKDAITASTGKILRTRTRGKIKKKT